MHARVWCTYVNLCVMCLSVLCVCICIHVYACMYSVYVCNVCIYRILGIICGRKFSRICSSATVHEKTFAIQWSLSLSIICYKTFMIWVNPRFNWLKNDRFKLQKSLTKITNKNGGKRRQLHAWLPCVSRRIDAYYWRSFSLPKRDDQHRRQVCHSHEQDRGSCWSCVSQDFISMCSVYIAGPRL